jgi:hypothetical protein
MSTFYGVIRAGKHGSNLIRGANALAQFMKGRRQAQPDPRG